MKNKTINEVYGLASRVKLVQIDINTIGIVKKRKSRIIMKDGLQILDIAKQIWKQEKNKTIALIVSGPICSKTTSFLVEHKIDILQEK
ncbi:MAG: hypothetical protein KAG64_06610 [Bacteroidales bacterium]|nr:hypothetical protein [Bacteroidales bacterium]